MIKEWKLDNFKSIDQEKDLEFRPLTIFTGANSSGKSTILQSILLVTQTLQSPIASRSIVLNGWFKKFGSYSDVVNRRDNERNIKIGFTIQNSGEDVRNDYYSRFEYDDNIKRTKCEFELSSDGKEECLQPVLEYTRIEAVYGRNLAERTVISSVVPKTERTPEEQEVIDNYGSKYQPRDFTYVLKSNNVRARMGYYGVTDNINILGTGLFHFLPSYLISYSSYKEQMKTALKDCLMSARRYYFNSEEDFNCILPNITEKVYAMVDDIYEKKKFRDATKYSKARNLIKKKITISRIINILGLGTLRGQGDRLLSRVV